MRENSRRFANYKHSGEEDGSLPIVSNGSKNNLNASSASMSALVLRGIYVAGRKWVVTSRRAIQKNPAVVRDGRSGISKGACPGTRGWTRNSGTKTKNG